MHTLNEIQEFDKIVFNQSIPVRSKCAHAQLE